MTNKQNNINFSKKMESLEKIAADLENSELDLDQAIDKFEQGARLAEELRQYLLTSKNRIQTLKKKFDQ